MSDETKPGCDQKPDSETASPRSIMPIWIIVLTLMLLFLGAVYFDYYSAWFDKQVYSPYASADDLAAHQPASGAASMLAQGRTVYGTYCGSCHGSNGSGKPGQAPPLAGSEWVAKDIPTLARIPLAGLNEPIRVMGQDWNLSMPPMGATLPDADLAAVLTYIRTAWGNTAGSVTTEDIKAARAPIGGKPPQK